MVDFVLSLIADLSFAFAVSIVVPIVGTSSASLVSTSYFEKQFRILQKTEEGLIPSLVVSEDISDTAGNSMLHS